MLKLQQQVNQLQSTVDEKDKLLQSLVEKVFDQVSGLSTSMQKINQTVDSVTSREDKNAADLRGLITVMNTHVNDLSDGLSAMRSQLSSVSQQITAMKTTTEALPGPDDAWRAAKLDMTVGNYEMAAGEMADFQAKYPTDPRSADAQVAKGDALFALKKYDQAVIEYDTFLQKYPQNDNTKTALYKKGLALAELNALNATTILQQVVKQYPGTVEATGAAQKLKEMAVPGARGKRPPSHSRENQQ